MASSSHRGRRREFLQATAAAGAAGLLPAATVAQERNEGSWRISLLKYLEGLARSDGGYGWDGQDRSHLTPTFAVIGCYKLLGVEPPKKAALAQFVRTHHPRELKNLAQEHRQFDWQQIQALVWLDEDVSSFRNLVLSWKAPYAYPKQYEQHGWPVFQQEVAAILCWKLLNLPTKDLPQEYIDYVAVRLRRNGSFNNTPADGSDGHVLNMWWALQASSAYSPEIKPDHQRVDWLRACQRSNGGFTYQPKAGLGGWDDVAYTWAAVRSLALYGGEPWRRSECVQYLHSLWNEDGGFSDRPGWLSNAMASYYALDSLAALGAIAEYPGPQRPLHTRSLRENFNVYSIQIEAHGQGSPAETIDLAESLKIHLWGAKNAKPQWLAQVRKLARKEGASVQFFAASEEYGTWIAVPGMGIYSHMSDVIAPAEADIGPSLANKGVVSWLQFQQARLAPLERNQGRLIWQFGENEPLVRMLLDDSLPEYYTEAKPGDPRRVHGGFAAISTFHFGNPDFINSDPNLMRWRGQLPFVALQDAHGSEPWWFADMTEGFRTLFLATAPTWEGWLNALRNNRVVAVRHDSVSGGKTWMHGMPEVIEVVKRKWREWQWWDNPTIQRPMVSIVALTPKDEFEIGRPDKGIAIRVRCAWMNTTQGLPKMPLTELVRLRVAREDVQPEHIVRRRANGAVEDHYYIYNWPDPPPGNYFATARVRHLVTREESSRLVEFAVPEM